MKVEYAKESVIKLQRENADRGIFLTTELNQEAYDRILPQIIRLRLQSSDPICLFIDSPGGNVELAEEIMRQIRAPNQDGKSCLLTTVCIGKAGSVAADLLAIGDYAIAYRGSLIHCHGTRHTRPQLTLEDVPRVAANIRANNERFALRLASVVFRRLVFIASTIPTDDKQTLMNTVVGAPDGLHKRIKENLESDIQALIDAAFQRQVKLAALIEYVANRLKQNDPPLEGLAFDAEVLKLVVDYEANQHATTSQSFSSDHLLTIQEDFTQIKDYFSGQYRKRLVQVVLRQGISFLEPNEEAEYGAIHENDAEARQKYLIDNVSPKLLPFWYLVVSLCRLLQEGEYTFLAREALWFGLIDEAIGAGLPSPREYREQRDQKKSESIGAATSPIVQPPPSFEANVPRL